MSSMNKLKVEKSQQEIINEIHTLLFNYCEVIDGKYFTCFSKFCKNYTKLNYDDYNLGSDYINKMIISIKKWREKYDYMMHFLTNIRIIKFGSKYKTISNCILKRGYTKFNFLKICREDLIELVHKFELDNNNSLYITNVTVHKIK